MSKENDKNPYQAKSPKELKELRGEKLKDLLQLRDKHQQVLLEEKRALTADEEQAWTRVNSEYDLLGQALEMARQAAEAEPAPEPEEPATEPEEPAEQNSRRREQQDRRLGRDDFDGRDRRDAGPSDESRALAFQGWMRAQCGLSLDERHTQAMQACGVRAGVRDFVIRLGTAHDVREARQSLRERRAMAAGTFTSGGAFVPRTLVTTLEVAMLQFGGILQIADVMRTNSGEPITWPTADDTSNEGVLLGENQEVSELDVTVGALVLNAYKYSSKMIRVPQELFEDSAIDMAAVVGQMLGERLGRIQSRHLAVGDGAAKPKGAVTSATLGVTAASATAIAADELFDLQHSVDPAYRDSPSVAWALHDSVLLAVRKLKDGNGRYLWEGDLQSGSPGTLLGKRVVVCQQMASSIAASAKTILFGDFSKYKVRQVREVRFRRLVERYAEYDQDAFLAFLRMDGGLLDAGTNPIKYLQQSA